MRLVDKFLELNANNTKITKQEKEIYIYILQNIENLENISAKELAEACFCTTTTINRLCKKLGVDGYNTFKAIICYELSQQKPWTEQIDLAQYEKELLVNLDKSKRIFLFGSGAALYSAYLVQRKLLKMRYIAIIIEDRYFLENVMEDQLFLFSNSGETLPTVDLAIKAKKLGMKTFAITAMGSELQQQVDYCLPFVQNYIQVNSNEHESQEKIFEVINELIKKM